MLKVCQGTALHCLTPATHQLLAHKYGQKTNQGSFPKLGVPYGGGVHMIRTMVFWGLYSGPPFLGKLPQFANAKQPSIELRLCLMLCHCCRNRSVGITSSKPHGLRILVWEWEALSLAVPRSSLQIFLLIAPGKITVTIIQIMVIMNCGNSTNKHNNCN